MPGSITVKKNTTAGCFCRMPHAIQQLLHMKENTK